MLVTISELKMRKMLMIMAVFISIRKMKKERIRNPICNSNIPYKRPTGWTKIKMTTPTLNTSLNPLSLRMEKMTEKSPTINPKNED